MPGGDVGAGVDGQLRRDAVARRDDLRVRQVELRRVQRGLGGRDARVRDARLRLRGGDLLLHRRALLHTSLCSLHVRLRGLPRVFARRQARVGLGQIGVGRFVRGAGGVDLRARDVALSAQLLGALEVEPRLLRVRLARASPRRALR